MPAVEFCRDKKHQETQLCKDLLNQKSAAEQAQKEADLDAEDVARLDNRPHPKSVTRIKSYSVSTRGIPGPARVQNLPYASGFFKDTEQTFDLEESGTLLGLKSSTTNHTSEFLLSILKAATGIAGRVITGAGKAPDTPAKEVKAKDSFLAFLTKDLSTPQKQLLENNFELLPAGRQKQYAYCWQDGENICSGAQRNQIRGALTLAKRSFVQIAELDKTLNDILPTSSGPGVQALIDENRKIYDIVIADWVGSKEVVSWTPTYEVTPANPNDTNANPKNPDALADNTPLMLFGIAYCGVDTADAELLPMKNPRPANLACGDKDPADPAPEFKTVTLSIVSSSDLTLSSAAKSKFARGPQEGLPFVIPGLAFVKIGNSGIKLREPQVLLAQTGFLGFLPKSLLSESAGVNVTYYQATGALKNIYQKTNAKLTGAPIDAAGAAILGTLDAKFKAEAAAKTQTQDAAKEAKGAELEDWTRLKNVLQARKDAEALCKELNVSPCTP